MGSAMGIPIAPAYASIFIDTVEQGFLNGRNLKPCMRLRFTRWYFMVWDHCLDSLQKFIDALNSFHSSFHFTYNNSQENVWNFTVSKSEGLHLIIDVHVKSTNVHQHMEYSSCHPKSCENGIPFSQGKRFRRIVSKDERFQDSIPRLRNFTLTEIIPLLLTMRPSVRVFRWHKTKHSKTLRILAIKMWCLNLIEFNLSLPNIVHIKNKYWDLLQLSHKESVNSLHASRTIAAFKWPKNLRDYLVYSYFIDSDIRHLSQKSDRRRCSHCEKKNCREWRYFQVSYEMRFSTSCTTKNAIYLIATCNILAKTNQQV